MRCTASGWRSTPQPRSFFVYDFHMLIVFLMWKNILMKVIQITMDAELAAQVDECARSVGATRSGFTRDALRAALRRHEEKLLEERHRAGYRGTPPRSGEFEVSEDDMVWGDDGWSDD